MHSSWVFLGWKCVIYVLMYIFFTSQPYVVSVFIISKNAFHQAQKNRCELATLSLTWVLDLLVQNGDCREKSWLMPEDYINCWCLAQNVCIFLNTIETALRM